MIDFNAELQPIMHGIIIIIIPTPLFLARWAAQKYAKVLLFSAHFFGTLPSFLLCIIDGWAFNWNWVVVITSVSGKSNRGRRRRFAQKFMQIKTAARAFAIKGKLQREELRRKELKCCNWRAFEGCECRTLLEIGMNWGASLRARIAFGRGFLSLLETCLNYLEKLEGKAAVGIEKGLSVGEAGDSWLKRPKR